MIWRGEIEKGHNSFIIFILCTERYKKSLMWKHRADGKNELMNDTNIFKNHTRCEIYIL